MTMGSCGSSRNTAILKNTAPVQPHDPLACAEREISGGFCGFGHARSVTKGNAPILAKAGQFGLVCGCGHGCVGVG